MATSLSRFRKDLLAWYDAEKRDLPWRLNRDAYSVWVSEIMLQQTTVAAVVPYFRRWMERFPTVESLAASDVEDALSVWQGLGYYRRCRNLHDASQIVVQNGLPVDFEGWLALPGIGAYTAGAICSISLDLQTPAVDGNVERVFARIKSDDSINLKKKATDWAQSLVDCNRPGDVTQALMELGATVCRPVAPVCDVCPVMQECSAKAQDRQDRLPTKKARREMVELQHVVCVPYCDGQFGVSRIEEGEWWEGLYEFPRGTKKSVVIDSAGRGRVTALGKLKHAVTHHKITIEAFLMITERASGQLDWVSPDALEKLPMPAPQRKIAIMAVSAIKDQRGKNSIGVASVPSSAKK